MQRAAGGSRQLLLEVTMHTKENTENADQKMQADTAPEKAPVEAGEQAPVDDEGKAAVPKKKRSRAGKKGEGKASARPGPRPMRRLEEDVIRKRRVEFKRRLAKHQRLSANAEKLIG
eukprot:3552860-Rhodomonas_salina.1